MPPLTHTEARAALQGREVRRMLQGYATRLNAVIRLSDQPWSKNQAQRLVYKIERALKFTDVMLSSLRGEVHCMGPQIDDICRHIEALTDVEVLGPGRIAA